MLPWLIENTEIALLLSGCVLLATWLLRPRAATCQVLWLLVLALLPSWSLAASAAVSGSGTGPQDPERTAAQDPQGKPQPIGRVAHLSRMLVAVRLDDGITAPRAGTTLWIGSGETVKAILSVTERGDGVVFGRLRKEMQKVATGDKVWLRPKREGPPPEVVFTGTVRHVAGRIVTMELTEAKTKLKVGQSWVVYVNYEEFGEAEVRLVDLQFVFLRCDSESPIPLGVPIGLARKTPAPEPVAPRATVKGELGKPLPVGPRGAAGSTLISDYSDNRIVEITADGVEHALVDQAYGAWDAERLLDGHLLITEFSVSRVRELDGDGKTVWEFKKLKNPYDADRLPNGNTLIADTFGSRVIEVDRKGQVVWKFEGVRAFDADRLQNGNTLIADVLQGRVIEIDRDGKLVWEAHGLRNVHDADRLQNGNTLVTLRTVNKVIELTADGRIVFEVGNLNSPSDADRLPNGNTLVAENGMVREFDPNGKVVWKREMTWAVEVNRY